MKTSVLIVASVIVSSVACAGNKSTAASAASPASDSASAAVGSPAAALEPQSPSRAAARLTPADLQDRMRKIGSAATAVRMQLMEKRLMDAAKEAQDIALWLGDVEKFWSQNTRPDAVMWAQQARQAATQMAGAAAAGDAAKAQMASTTLLGSCQMCHDAYRESDNSGGFRIKAGAVR